MTRCPSLAFAIAWLSPCCCIAAARLVPDGILGQSGTRDDPVEWTDCRYCAADGAGNVYFPGGWRLARGDAAPKRMSKTVPGELVSDGESVYSWRADRGTLTRLSVDGDGLAVTDMTVKIGAAARSLRRPPAAAATRRTRGYSPWTGRQNRSLRGTRPESRLERRSTTDRAFRSPTSCAPPPYTRRPANCCWEHTGPNAAYTASERTARRGRTRRGRS